MSNHRPEPCQRSYEAGFLADDEYKSDLIDLKDRRYFALIDLVKVVCSFHWKKSYSCSTFFMNSMATVIPTRTLQGSRNSRTSFQSQVESCFARMRHTLKAWLDDFAMHTPTEEQLLKELKSLLAKFRERNQKDSLPK